ncbi:hypothetical protein [Pelotomaculum schinkii]|uniref:hypothetical protein n=1 Tax=Pelotomaculum schinkii TaxID=78350 RepID=UPI00167D34DC|nr:hypothetical protein [Pelotomaculum schinkii]
MDCLESGLNDILNLEDALGWKVCNDLSGLLRPDKFIVYFESTAPLFSLGDRLQERLDGVPSHGVPFTAELGGNGLLSWGLDPPRLSGGPGASLSESWRTWLADRIAGALWQSRQQGLRGERACEAALLRLQTTGVDIDRWMPTEPLFGKTGPGD